MVKEERGEEEENSTVRGGSTREKEPVGGVFYEVYCEEQVTAGMARRVRDPPGRPPGLLGQWAAAAADRCDFFWETGALKAFQLIGPGPPKSPRLVSLTQSRLVMDFNHIYKMHP